MEKKYQQFDKKKRREQECLRKGGIDAVKGGEWRKKG